MSAISTLPLWARELRRTYNLMKHETLAMYPHTYPFDFTIYLRIPNLQTHHIPLNSLVVERLANSIIVEITTSSASPLVPHPAWSTHCVPSNCLIKALNLSRVASSTLQPLLRSYSPFLAGSVASSPSTSGSGSGVASANSPADPRLSLQVGEDSNSFEASGSLDDGGRRQYEGRRYS